MTLEQIKSEYAPYDKMASFSEGFDRYMVPFRKAAENRAAGRLGSAVAEVLREGNVACPYDGDSADAQAWDRGQLAAKRWLDISPAVALPEPDASEAPAGPSI